MSKTRVPRGEKYYLINTTLGTLEVDYLRDWRTGEDDAFFKTGNYFHSQEEAETMARKLRAVLKGAEVIEWHKVSEELPKNGGFYLCMDENKHIVQLAFCGTKWVNTSQFIDIDLCLVKYWMPIPELPKED